MTDADDLDHGIDLDQFSKGQKRDSEFALTDDTLLKENPNEFVNFIAKDGDFDKHITIPKDDPQDAHYSEYMDGDPVGHEPLDF